MKLYKAYEKRHAMLLWSILFIENKFFMSWYTLFSVPWCSFFVVRRGPETFWAPLADIQTDVFWRPNFDVDSFVVMMWLTSWLLRLFDTVCYLTSYVTLAKFQVKRHNWLWLTDVATSNKDVENELSRRRRESYQPSQLFCFPKFILLWVVQPVKYSSELLRYGVTYSPNLIGWTGVVSNVCY